MTTKLPIRRRNRLPAENYQGAKAYSLTLPTHHRNPWFRDAAVVEYCVRALMEATSQEPFQVYAYCFMPDHLHLLVGTSADANLLGFVKSFKQSTGWWFRNRYLAGSLKTSPTSLWQKSYYDHVVRCEEDLVQIAKYILGNPVRAGLVGAREEYPFSGSFVWGRDVFTV
jgi:putative transposase